MEHSIISDIAISIVAAWVLAVLAQLLKQPLILAYLVAGFAVGPIGFGWIKNHNSISTISELGLILLLFMIGLEIDLKKILSAGRLITVTAGAQILGGCALGLGFFWAASGWLGVGKLDILYLSVAAALSSTVIIVKILYDKRELDSLSGRITLGVLIVQDIFAILFLAVQPNLKNPEFSLLAISLVKVVILVAVTFTASRFALPPLFRAVARLPELVLVGALAWCFMVAALASVLDLSREMGALVAGVAISTYPYTLDVTAKVTTLRDFFVTLFFVGLGMTIPKPTLFFVAGALAFSAFLLTSRFLTVFWPLYWMKQGNRASFLPALHLCQVSEFSLVILALGATAGHISAATQGITAYAFVLLAVASSYMILKSDGIFRKASVWLKRFNIQDLDAHVTPHAPKHHHPRIFLLGFFRTGSSLLTEIERHDPGWLRDIQIIDFHPHVNEELRNRGINVIYGDISQRDTLVHAEIHRAEIIVCTLPDTILKGTSNMKLLQQLRELNNRAAIIVLAESLNDVPELYKAGASYVCLPRISVATDLFSVIHAVRHKLLDERRAAQNETLSDRNEVVV